MKDKIKKAVEVLSGGGIIAYPTETLFGIGCDATNEKAVERLIELKKRDEKPMSVACSNMEMIEEYVEIGSDERKILESFLPGPYTFLLTKKETVPDLVTAGSKKVGIRVPDYPPILKIIERFRKPIISTSANLAGRPDIKSLDELKLGVDYVLAGECKYKKGSTVVDISNKKVLRPGVRVYEIEEEIKNL